MGRIVTRFTIPIGALAFVILSIGTCFAATKVETRVRYVATNGSDSNPGTLTAPFKTIDKGISMLTPGDTLYVRAGVYTEALVVSSSGTASAPILISAYANELPIIDGQGRLPLRQGQPLILLKGSYVQMQGFEVRNSNTFNSAGVVLDGEHDIVSHMNVHHHYAAGILARGDYTIVEYSTVWQNAYRNCRAKGCPPTPYPNGGWATGVSAARSPVDGITYHAILRKNVVYNNWGEGLSTYEARGTVMEDNIVYDNWATNTYISDASDVVFQRNLIYTTANNAVGIRRACITLADERSDKPRSEHNIVVNNMCLNGDLYAFAWTLVPQSGLVKALIANNTIVNGALKTGPINRESKIVNNIIAKDDAVAYVPTTAGLMFANNLWSTAPPSEALGTHSLIQDPKILKVGSTDAGQLTSTYFSLSMKSPAHQAGINLGDGLTVDAFGQQRKSPPTIGAYEIR
ncbi:MAG: right-handed parallel beta-helix repeat-containing protein [Acidobacteriaceae bacterium]|jgi:hypothetical protein|nr:right-handed parallel beta-helix repeat-containing protein [Acidobacteriaceae bacterium]